MIKEQTFENGALSKLIGTVISFKFSIKIAIIDKCTVTEQDLRTTITSFSMFGALSELLLQDMHIGPLSLSALFLI